MLTICALAGSGSTLMTFTCVPVSWVCPPTPAAQDKVMVRLPGGWTVKLIATVVVAPPATLTSARAGLGDMPVPVTWTQTTAAVWPVFFTVTLARTVWPALTSIGEGVLGGKAVLGTETSLIPTMITSPYGNYAVEMGGINTLVFERKSVVIQSLNRACLPEYAVACITVFLVKWVSLHNNLSLLARR